MSFNTVLLSVALTFGFCAPALAEAPESMMIAQAKGKSIKTRRRGKRVTRKVVKKKVVAKKAAPAVEMAGEVLVERTAKGAVKAAHLVLEGGEKVQLVLNPKGRSLAKLGGAMKVTGKVHTRKGVKFMRVATFAALPKPVVEPEVVEAAPKAVEPPAAVIADDGGDDDAPSDDDAPNDDAPSDDDSMNDDAPANDDDGDEGGE